MKLSRSSMAASVLSLALLAGACDDGLTDLNKNPNGPTAVPAEFVFPNGVTGSVGLLRGQYFDMTFTSLFAQHFAKIQYTEEDRYEIRTESNEAWWQSLYAGPLQDFRAAERDAEARKKPGLVAPVLVMRSWAFGAMTDVWGDIPYSEANKGDEEGATVTPKYDSQKDVYNGILAELKRASDIAETGGSYGSADPIYNGDAGKWKRFANSLRLRYAMRLSKVDPSRAQSEIQAALAAGVFTSNADNANLVWPGDKINDSPIFENSKSRDDHRVSKTIVDQLKAFNDPRLAVYANPAAATGEYVGVQNGLTSPDAVSLGLTKTSKIGTFFAKANAASAMMHYSEVLFIQAEAAARGWASGSPAELYKQAITASMQVYGIPQAQIDAYLAQPSVEYKGLESIALQKWIALYGQGIEAWSEYRRTGVPNLQPGPAAVLDMVPRRLPYPATEQSFNNANLQAAKSAQGGDLMTNRLWWDK